jgi:hypothetical protein
MVVLYLKGNLTEHDRFRMGGEEAPPSDNVFQILSSEEAVLKPEAHILTGSI